MIVTTANFSDVVQKLSLCPIIAVDTETNGLNSFAGHRLFSIIIADHEESYYFNFKSYGGLDPIYQLPRFWIAQFQPILSNPDTQVYGHNFKFDMHMLAREGLQVHCQIHDTEVCARMLHNQHFSYSLDECVKRDLKDTRKSGEVEAHIRKHRLYTEEVTPEGKKIKNKRFDLVPFDIISKYGEQDGRITYLLGAWQRVEMAKLHHATPEVYKKSILDVYANEKKLLKVCFQMEEDGIKIDRDYCQRAYNYEIQEKEAAAKEFELVSGFPLVDSGKSLARAFEAVGADYPRTEKGNPSFTADVLEDFDTPLAKILLRYRAATKLAGTYYANFLKLADAHDRIHADIRLAGTATFRFSMSEPNLQNLKRLDEGEIDPKEFNPRKAFIPSSHDHALVMVDYNAMEFRMMLDMAGEMRVIKRINEEGLDVHRSTAEAMKVTRQEAKTLNFMLIYGGGVKKLASKLDIPVEKARQLYLQYFQEMPRVIAICDMIKATAKTRRWLVNWAGYHYQFPVGMSDHVAPNHMIQGGCAQIVRIGMPLVADVLRGTKSKMLVQVHDELLFDMHRDDFGLIPRIKKIMEEVYPYKDLPMTCEVSHSYKSWGDKVKGMPV